MKEPADLARAEEDRDDAKRPLLSEPKRYEIRTIADFMAVPVDSLNNCMLDLEMFLRSAHGLHAAFGSVGRMDLSAFKWIDDGKHDANMTITLKSGSGQ